ncbi:MAG TPA: LysM peptidoglycan-binding domain-containing protein [Thermodesulfobacteriota bacterium]|nr:LysM peptidoglycan-binding domain-containing protein [Thermodesulfobacteriota bacterium]
MILKRSALLLMLILLPTAVFAAKRYVVKKGDNLGNLAKRFRVSIQSIKKTNGLNTDRLNVGKTLIIPDAINNQTNVIASKDSEKNENELEVNKTNLQSFSLRYIVKKEDTLSGIANRFGISVEKISYVNGLTENGLKTGMILTIPDSRNKDLGNMIFSPTAQVGVEPKLVSSDGHREYIVKDGDSLTSIAEGCGVSVSDLKNANGLSSEEVRIGTKLIIPDSQIPMRVVRVSPNVNETNNYIVKKDDALSTIASKYNVSVKNLMSANNLKSNEVRIGTKLIIPDSQIPMRVVRVSPNENEINKYVVKKGDTLSKIASRYRVSVKDLKNVNGMKSDKVKFGMSLIIPNSTLSRNVEPKTPVISDNNKYIVQKGDNISSISRRYGVSQAELKRANNIKGDTIKSGQLLRVPSKINGKNELVVEDIKVEDNDTHINSLPEIETAKAIQSNDSSTYENGLTRDVIISIAKRFLGAPYKFGGDSLIRGLDCSAFVNKVFTFFNVDLPRTAREMYKIGRNVTKGELEAGDLVFFKTYASYPSHVGIYIGDSEFIHASSAAKRVRIDNIDQSYYRKRYIGAKRVVSTGIFYEELSKDYKGFEKQ